MDRSWSRLEVEATVADYVAMLGAELRDESFNKTAHRRALQPLLNDRSEGAIERKHQNISAILIELGFKYIDGYKPLFNYQQLLFDVVEDRLRVDTDLSKLVESFVKQAPPIPEVDDILDVLVNPPEPLERSKTTYTRPAIPRRTVDYLAIEVRNSALGSAGEDFALNFERARLIHAGKPSLADQIEHTSVVEGDGTGYDIRSYETDGSDRFIEVKTTTGGIYTPIYLSRNELYVSKELHERYHLYRPFTFRKNPRLFTLAGALDETCRIEATQFVGRVG